MTTDNECYRNYLVDIVYLIRESAAESRALANTSPLENSFSSGRELAFTEVLMLMQSQADAFLISRSELGLDFDPLGDELTPRPRASKKT